MWKLRDKLFFRKQWVKRESSNFSRCVRECVIIRGKKCISLSNVDSEETCAAINHCFTLYEHTQCSLPVVVPPFFPNRYKQKRYSKQDDVITPWRVLCYKSCNTEEAESDWTWLDMILHWPAVHCKIMSNHVWLNDLNQGHTVRPSIFQYLYVGGNTGDWIEEWRSSTLSHLHAFQLNEYSHH